MTLTEKKCVPCEGGMPPLTEEQSNELLKELSGWSLQKGHLLKEVSFKDFREAISFVNKLANLAENEGHHPNISINYNKVLIELYTHAINGLSENDFILAAKTDKL